MPAQTVALIRPATSNPASLVPRLKADVSGGAKNTLKMPAALPLLLAGPILRRAAPSGIHIWLATSEPLTVDVVVYKPTGADISPFAGKVEIGRGSGAPTQIGAHLYLYLVKVTPTGAPYPLDHLLAYDMKFHAPKGRAFTDGSVGLLERQKIAYGDLPLPTFVLGPKAGSRHIHLLHASCRKLHGPGKDAIITADEYLEATAKQKAIRPSLFLFTGDQIYADDVADGFIDGFPLLSAHLLGWIELTPAQRWTGGLKPAERGTLVRAAGFTVDESVAKNHLLGFGEFAAMYLLAWAPELWDFAKSQRIITAVFRDSSIEAIRRVMANIPSYMLMDDHEISDDWPITEEQRSAVQQSTFGSWVAANGLASCWMFQLWGNTPDQQPAFRPALLDYLAQGRSLDPLDAAKVETWARSREKYCSAVLSERDFGFITPTNPPVIFLDTRTQRSLHAGRPPGLLDNAAIQKLRSQIDSLPGDKNAPILLVSPAPVIGYAPVEDNPKVRPHIGKSLDVTKDPEAWSYDGDAYYTFITMLAQSGRKRFVFFSGDVHYSFFVDGNFSHSPGLYPPAFHFVQLTSSALRNEPTGKLALLMNVVTGWYSPGGYYYGHGHFWLHPGSSYPVFCYPEPHGDTDYRIGTLSFRLRPVAGKTAPYCAHNNFGVVNIVWTADGTTDVTQELKGDGVAGKQTKVTM